ncbi:Serine/threonine-protein kinase Tel1 [Cercospora zeina]
MAQVSLESALDLIQANTVTKRQKGLADLKHILRHNRDNSRLRNLDDKDFKEIFKPLYEIALDGQTSLLNAKTTSTRTTAANRLSDIAGGLRMSVEAGVRVLKGKTVKTVLDHVTGCMFFTNGTLCEPLALDYAKTLRAILNYQPHVEQMTTNNWDKLAKFCSAVISQAQREVFDDDVVGDGALASTGGGILHSLSHVSSRSTFRESAGSQGKRVVIKPVAEEMAGCLRLLTVAPNAPRLPSGIDYLWTIINALKTFTLSQRAHLDAFGAINNILSWMRTDGIRATQKATSQLLRLVRQFWSAKSAAVGQMLITILLLRPYISHSLQGDERVTMLPELNGLLHTLETEYSNTYNKIVLKPEDLRLELNHGTSKSWQIATALFSLRCAGSRAELSWVLVNILAFLRRSLITAERHKAFDSDNEADQNEDEIDHRPRKRQRLADPLSTLIETTHRETAPERICALHTLTFLAQQLRFSGRQLRKVLDSLLISCSEDNLSICSWAFLAAASCAAQPCASSPELVDQWNTVWQLGVRALGNNSTCRAAAYLLAVLLASQITSQAQCSELVHLITHTIDLSGPSQLSEAVMLLLTILMRASQQQNPTTAATTSESIISWLSQNFKPSKLEDKQITTNCLSYEASDIVALTSTCLGQALHQLHVDAPPVWDTCARAWLACMDDEAAISYLLLEPAAEVILSDAIKAFCLLPLTPGHSSRMSTEALVLTYHISELTQCQQSWKELVHDRARPPSKDAIAMLCKASLTSTCISRCMIFKDSRRQSQLQGLAAEMLDTLSIFVASDRCEGENMTAFLSILSAACSGLPSQLNDAAGHRPRCEQAVCHAIHSGLTKRYAIDDMTIDDDAMDFEDAAESQQSRGSNVLSNKSELLSDQDASYSSMALRVNVHLYTVVVIALQGGTGGGVGITPPSKAAVDFLLSLSDEELLSCRDVIVNLPGIGLVLTSTDTRRLLKHFMEDLKARFAYRLSEVALGCVLDIMKSLIDVWTDSTEHDLFCLGLDTYDWFVEYALTDNVFSPSVQKRLALLLVQLCQLKLDYGRDSDSGTPRSCCFKLLGKLPIAVQYKLADHIPTLFGRLVLSEHARMFEDLAGNLPTNLDWPEGMALRLLHLSKLGSSWRSLLRSCTWLIFETAGRADGCAAHARKCIQELAASLPLQSPQKLFSLFAPQLLYTWLENGHSIARLPLGTFHYDSLHDLLRRHRSEMMAQLVLRDDESGLETMQKALRLMPRDAIKQSYGKCVAYCIAKDVVRKPLEGEDPNHLEHRLRDSMGGKDQHKKLISRHLPTIVGYIFLTTEQDAQQDKWLIKHDGYTQTAEALAEMTKYSRKEEDLPPALEPSFDGHYLMDQLIRLCKRVNASPLSMWDASSFVLTSRMLLDAVDVSLGSLQCCRIIRRVMIVVALAGKIALDGFGPEMLIHSLRPFMSDSACANDTIGLLQYLFDRSREYLRSALRFTTGAIILLVLQMRKHSRSRHDSTTQESHHSETVRVMGEFQTWLVNYFSRLIEDTPRDAYSMLSEALAHVKLPGNATADSAESSLLLFLLDQWNAEDPLCSRDDVVEAIQIIAEDFVAPPTPGSDCLGEDARAVTYSQQIWEVLQIRSLSTQFTVWAATALGRAYAATGARPVLSVSEEQAAGTLNAEGALRASHAVLVTRVARLVYSQERSEAGLAEYALRKMQDAFAHSSDTEGVIQFQEMAPESIYSAIYGGPYGYEPALAVMDRFSGKFDITLVQKAMALSSETSLETWATELASALSSWAAGDPILSTLMFLFQNIRGLATELLPQIIHILLATEHATIAPLLSKAVTDHLCVDEEDFTPKQQFLLRVLLYLRSQPFPGEATNADRVHWLDIDYMVAARAAARCAMPAAALLLAESTSFPAVQGSRRNSRRVSSSQDGAGVRPPSELLLSVYKQMEEPDSFYGVAQEASLSAVLERLDHEGDGFRSMMFRSAQMDSHVRSAHRLAEHDAIGMIQSLSNLNFNSLAFALVAQGVGSTSTCREEMLRAAQSLQQWDVAPPAGESESSAAFSVLQELSRVGDVTKILDRSTTALLDFVKSGIGSNRISIPSHTWYANLASLTEISEVTAAVADADLDRCWEVFARRHAWMHFAKFEEVKVFLSGRHTLFGVLSHNPQLQQSMHVTLKRCRILEVEALLAFSRLSREHSKLQEALTATATMSDMVATCEASGIKVDSAVKLETASVLWDAGEATMSVKMLSGLSQPGIELGSQDVHVGRAGLLAQLAHESAEARLEKPEQILSKYLKPALSAVGKTTDWSEISKVHYEFAKFCDHELQNPSSIENLNRITKLRQSKEEEVEAYRQALQTGNKTQPERHQMSRSLHQAQTWLQLDTAEEKRLRKTQSDHVNLSLQNYLQALAASEDHDICVLRFFALWLENTDGIDQGPDATVLKYLPHVPSWKFVRLMNQLMSRLDDAKTPFQQALSALLQRICTEHPWHSLHHLFAPRSMNTATDPATASRYRAAKAIHHGLRKNVESAKIAEKLFRADTQYKVLAESKPESGGGGSKIDVKHFHQASLVYKKIPELEVPPATITLALRPSGSYSDVPIVTRVDRTVSIMSGLSAPKMLKLQATDGKWYRELYKSGDDDLRQDAIMEQVFDEVSNMLRNHKATRQRDLKLRTYKVIPLSSGSGIIEFVPNSIPIVEFLGPAHKKYHPKDIAQNKARDTIARAYANGQGTTTDRLAAFQKVCANLSPVMRHFFLERFHDPDEWFAKRTAYSRTTASISILGHIIGLGDRHCSNILLDEQTGEVVHIDLGVAFEAGRVLPIPELVPFRLTRDIVDGMGTTGVEGVFRRCCEFTLDAVREDKDSIMTLLNVLRYDPLHNWTISPLRAKKMQDEQSEVSRCNGAVTHSSKKKEEEAGEADRALSIVEKKLSKTLSTAAAVNELIQQATDEKHLAVLFAGWAAYF